MRNDASRDPSERVELEVRGWYGFRRARLRLTPTRVLIIHRDGGEEIARATIERVRCSVGLPLDKVSLWTDGRVLVFRVGDVTRFASWVQRSRLAPHIDLDNDVMEAVRDLRGLERSEEQVRTGLVPGGGIQTANIGQRLIARIIDLVVVFAIAFVVAKASGSSDDAFVGFLFATVVAYEIPLIAFRGCTLGKLWPGRIRVVAVKSGRRPGLLRAIIRTLLVWPTIFLGRLRFFLPTNALGWLDGFHDRVAGTVVLTSSGLRALHEQPESDRRRLLGEAQERQLAVLPDEERELMALSDDDD